MQLRRLPLQRDPRGGRHVIALDAGGRPRQWPGWVSDLHVPQATARRYEQLIALDEKVLERARGSLKNRALRAVGRIERSGCRSAMRPFAVIDDCPVGCAAH